MSGNARTGRQPVMVNGVEHLLVRTEEQIPRSAPNEQARLRYSESNANGAVIPEGSAFRHHHVTGRKSRADPSGMTSPRDRFSLAKLRAARSYARNGVRYVRQSGR